MDGVLVAGGSGLIGRALTARLAGVDDCLRIRSLGGSQEVDFQSSKVEYFKCDFLSNPDLVGELEGMDSVVFCAGGAGGMGQFKSRPTQMALDAGLMNLNLLKACTKASVQRIIMIASATMYPDCEGAVNEDQLDMQQDPASAHFGLGWSWRYLETLAKWMGEECGMEVVVLRTANVFGPYGRFDPDFSNFIPAIIRKAADRIDPFEVYGSPSVTRDVLYVEHLIDAIVALLEKCHLGIRSFNVGSGYATRVGDVVDWALKYADHVPVFGVSYSDSKYAAPVSRYLDCSRISNFINWKPPVSAESGISKLVAWWIENQSTWTR